MQYYPYELKEERARKGEWNEALCFYIDQHPQTEIAAQKCRDHWNIFYVSSKHVMTLRSGIKTQASAESAGKRLAELILPEIKPIIAARSYR